MIQFIRISTVILGLVFSNSFSPCFSQNNASKVSENISPSLLENAQNLFVTDPVLANASIGICVLNAKTGERKAQYNSNISLTPASTVKLFSTATSLEVLGKDFRPKTRIYASKAIDAKGNLNGNLWIRGGGDVSLGSRYFNKEEELTQFLSEWADTLYKMGLRKISGSVIGDASEFGYMGAGDGWNWADMGNYYGAGPSGLPIYDNMLRYYFKVNASIGSNAELLRTFPEIEGLNFKSNITGVKAAGDNSYIYGAPYSMDVFGTGYLPVKSSNFMVKGTLPDSELQFAQAFEKALIARGIQITEKAQQVRKMNLGVAWKRYTSGPVLIYTHSGRSLGEIVQWTNQKSVNLFAEQLLTWVGYASNGNGGMENSLNYLEKFWRDKINLSGLYLTDGSGLSRSNAVSASHFCELLKYMYSSPKKTDFISSLPIAGVSGTLSEVCKNQAAHGKIKAKSGTMTRVKSYAGYLETNAGETYCFAIIVNNYNCSTASLLKRIEKWMNVLVVS